MASANPTQNKAIAKANVAKPAQQRAGQASQVQVAAPTRREFLYYIWGASIVMLLGQATAGLLWFVYPRFREGEFGGVFPFNPEDLPPKNIAPATVSAGRFHVTNTEGGVLALYGVCTHLGCLPRWVETNEQFECPCHGSKFSLDGGYITGPAPRALDRFPVEITYTDGSTAITNDKGDPIELDPGKQIASVRVDTGRRITGPLNNA